MQKTGTLEIDSNLGISKLDGTVLAIKGHADSDHQVGAATTFLENHHFRDGDQAQITGDSGKLPEGTAAIFMTDAQPLAARAAAAQSFAETSLSAFDLSATSQSKSRSVASTPRKTSGSRPVTAKKAAGKAEKKKTGKKKGGERP